VAQVLGGVRAHLRSRTGIGSTGTWAGHE